MSWVKVRPVLMALSLGLNAAFLGLWGANILASCPIFAKVTPQDTSQIWCPLHRELGVSGAQWHEIEPMLTQFKQSAREIDKSIGEARQQMIDLMARPEADMVAIRTKQAEILTGQGKMQAAVITHLLAEKKVLTPEQQAQLFELIRAHSVCGERRPFLMKLGPES